MDILIDGDFYWNFICNSFVRGDSGTISFLNKVRYVLSGPTVEGANSVHSNLISLHAIKTQCTVLGDIENL